MSGACRSGRYQWAVMTPPECTAGLCLSQTPATIGQCMAWSKQSRHERGYGSVWTKIRERILKRDMYLCQACLKLGRTTPATQVDHITPKAQGGTDDDGNLQAICAACHLEKSLAEAAQAQGRTIRPKLTFTRDGKPLWPE